VRQVQLSDGLWPPAGAAGFEANCWFMHDQQAMHFPAAWAYRIWAERLCAMSRACAPIAQKGA